jgi:ribosomal RNA-processing protein 17
LSVIQKRRILAEQAAQNATKVEEAYGGLVQRTSHYLLSSVFNARLSGWLTWFSKKKKKKIPAVESDSDGEWTGINSSSSGAGADGPGDHDAGQREREYSDEEQLATVTVVEDFDPSTLLGFDDRDGGRLSGVVVSEEPRERASPPRHRKVVEGERVRRGNDASKNKKVGPGTAKKVRYETKAARKSARAKQQARRTEKAERARGKAPGRKERTGGKKKRKVPRR